MLKSTLRRGTLSVGLIVLSFVLSAFSPSSSVARTRRSGKAVRKTSHSASHKRHAKFSSKHHRIASRPLSGSEKTAIIQQLKSAASVEILPEENLSSESDTQLTASILADMAQAAQEERDEDNSSVSLDSFLAGRDATSVSNPDVLRSREMDFTLFESADPKIASTRTDVMQHIIDWVGTRYVFGGAGREGIDCSAFTREVFRRSFNVELPRTAVEQSELGEEVSKRDLKFGDLVFFKTARYAPVTHVGIYVGEGYFANAQSSRGVTVASLGSDYWSKKYLFAKRLFTNTATAQAGTTNKLKIAEKLPVVKTDADAQGEVTPNAQSLN
jgi:cell wall-associated NlpC family hydrolase